MDAETESAEPLSSLQNNGVYVSGAEHFGIPLTTDVGRLFSPSFSSVVEAALPLSSSSETVAFGGQWFWELYQHCVLREHVLVYLGGTGVDLEEDSLETQKMARAEAVRETQKNPNLDGVWRHRSAKMEAVYALALSIALRVVREPMLGDNQGPQAVVLCATKDQCDELTFALNRFCADLHLVVHNLFEPYPAMPVGKLAEVVVATPPLWEAVYALTPRESIPKSGLEDILKSLFPTTVPPTYAATHLRPYSLERVVEMAFFDVARQYHQGFGMMLSAVVRRLPPTCRFTLIYQQNCEDTHTPALPITTKPFKQKELAVLGYGTASKLTRKRSRDTPVENGGQSLTDLRVDVTADLSSGLLVWNGLSLTRLFLDQETFREFRAGVEAEALRFWEGFEGKPITPEDLSAFVEFRVLLVCHIAPHDGHLAHLSSTCLSVLPTAKGLDLCGSRLLLLFAHLEDHLSGSLFDGSVVTCTNLTAKNDTLSSIRRRFSLAAAGTSIHADVLAVNKYLCDRAGISSQVAIEVLGEEGHCDNDDESAATLIRKRTDAAALLAPAASDFITGNASAPFPRGFFLPNERPTSDFTVVVVRQCGVSAEALLTATAPDDAKPIVLTLIEECCQYGRVLSYYCHCGNGETASAGPASLFVEFETEASAVEAVRLLTYRFSLVQGTNTPRARLFRNATYYEGVFNTEVKRLAGTVASATDDLFDDLMEMDLLAE